MRHFVGFYIQKRSLRYYNTHSAANVLGYISEVNEWELKNNPYYVAGELKGHTGIEKQYEESEVDNNDSFYVAEKKEKGIWK